MAISRPVPSEEKIPTTEFYLGLLEEHLWAKNKSAAERFENLLTYLRTQPRDQFKISCEYQFAKLTLEGQLEFVFQVASTFDKLQTQYQQLMKGQNFAAAEAVADISGRFNEIATVLAEKRALVTSRLNYESVPLTPSSTDFFIEQKQAPLPKDMHDRYLEVSNDPNADIFEYIKVMYDLTTNYMQKLYDFSQSMFLTLNVEEKRFTIQELTTMKEHFENRVKGQVFKKVIQKQVEEILNQFTALLFVLNEAVNEKNQTSKSEQKPKSTELRVATDSTAVSSACSLNSPLPSSSLYGSSSAMMLSPLSPLVRTCGKGASTKRVKEAKPATTPRYLKPNLMANRPDYFSQSFDESDDDLQKALAASLETSRRPSV